MNVFSFQNPGGENALFDISVNSYKTPPAFKVYAQRNNAGIQQTHRHDTYYVSGQNKTRLWRKTGVKGTFRIF